MNRILASARELPIAERIKLVEEIWDTIATEPTTVTLTSEQMAELDRRIEYHRLHPEDAIPWETVRDKMLASLERR